MTIFSSESNEADDAIVLTDIDLCGGNIEVNDLTTFISRAAAKTRMVLVVTIFSWINDDVSPVWRGIKFDRYFNNTMACPEHVICLDSSDDESQELFHRLNDETRSAVTDGTSSFNERAMAPIRYDHDSSDSESSVSFVLVQEAGDTEQARLPIREASKPRLVSQSFRAYCEGSDESDDSVLDVGPAFSQSSMLSSSRLDKEYPCTVDMQTIANDEKDQQGNGKTTKHTTQPENHRRPSHRRGQTKAAQKKQSRREEQLKRRRAREAEKAQKKDRLKKAQQATGKFASQEACVLVNPSLQGALPDIFSSLCKEVLAYPGLDPGAVQFIRKDFLAGGALGAKEALQKGDRNGYEHLDRLVVVFHKPTDFLVLLKRSELDDDYPALGAWFRKLTLSWKRAWDMPHRNPHVVVLLPNIFAEVNKQWSRADLRAASSPITDAEVHDAIVWMMINFQVDCLPLSSIEQVQEILEKMARALSEEPYKQQVTELECVRKRKSHLEDLARASPFEKAHDAWIRQLQVMPGMSEMRARNVAQHYPTPQCLWQAYRDPDISLDDKSLLLANIVDSNRRLPKLSDAIFRLMSLERPSELV